MPISDQRMEELTTATDSDETVQQLGTVIQRGWPKTKDGLPPQLTPYFSIRDTLTVQDGILMKGERLVIPISMRTDIKHLLHALL